MPKSSSRNPNAVTGIEISNVAITEFRFSDEFNRAIEMKVKAQQEALQAENEKEKIITQAEAEKAKKQLGADANAYQVLKEAEARAKAIRLEAQALASNSNLIKLRMAEKWDGVLPKFTGGGTIPMLDVANLINDDNRSKSRRRRAADARRLIEIQRDL